MLQVLFQFPLEVISQVVQQGKIVEYKNNSTNITIICPIHGEFQQTPKGHLSGYGCPKCSGKYSPTTEEFIKRAREVHGDKYDYSKADYKNRNTKITIICPEHGEFEQRPADHLRGQGCPNCHKITSQYKLNILLKEEDLMCMSCNQLLEIIAIRKFNKKILLKAPLHHHFEELGWEETDIVKIFWVAGFLLAMFGVVYGVWL